MTRRPSIPAALSIVAAVAVAASPGPARATVTDAELRDSVVPLTLPVRSFAPRQAVVDLERRTSRNARDVSADVLFDFGRAAVRRPGRVAVRRLARSVFGRTGTLRIVGHTDGVGGATFNRRLSLRRAEAVADVVRSVLPPSVRIVPVGRGASDPVADETTSTGKDDPEGRARNRRVELRFGR